MDLSGFEDIALRRDGFVLHAAFDRPATLNAIDGALHDSLNLLIEAVATDDQTRVLVLTGNGKAFSAGGKMEAIQETIDNPRLFLDGIAKGKELIHALLDCPKPIIAKVNGPAIGLGATIALFCDVTIAAQHAKIADPHVKIGLVAGDGGAAIWPALIGYNRAKRYLLTGDAITGAEAAAIGLIDRAVAAAELDEVVDQLALRMAEAAPRAVQWTKLSVNIGLKNLVQQVLDSSLAYEALTNRTADHQEAVNAFMEKRPPIFIGD
jgi:enoyl-CoA hydratase